MDNGCYNKNSLEEGTANECLQHLYITADGRYYHYRTLQRMDFIAA